MATAEQIARWRELAEASTPAPWYPHATDDAYAMNARYVGTEPGDGHHDGDWGMTEEADRHGTVVAITLLQAPRLACHASERWDEDTAFIAAAREAVPALCAEVERLRVVLRELGMAMTGVEMDALHFVREYHRYSHADLLPGESWRQTNCNAGLCPGMRRALDNAQTAREALMGGAGDG